MSFKTARGRSKFVGHGLTYSLPIPLDPTAYAGAVVYADDNTLHLSNGLAWSQVSERGFTGSVGISGFTGSRGIQGFTGSQGIQGPQGTSINIIGTTPDVNATYNGGLGGPNDPSGYLLFTFPGSLQGDAVIDLATSDLWIFTDPAWENGGPLTGPTGFTGSAGFVGSSGFYVWITRTTAYTASAGDAIMANTTGGAFTITLPATPAIGDSVIVADSGNWSVNNLTIARNGNTIENDTLDFILDIEGIKVDFIYDGTTWQVFTNLGAQGEIGFTGSQGSAGDLGFTGSIGFTGSRGDSGFTGSRGFYTWSVITTNYTALVGDAIITDTSGGSFTVTLPAAPTAGQSVIVTDSADWSVNNLTIARNGNTIENIADDFLLDVQGIKVDFIYDGSTWQVFTNLGQQGIQGFTGSRGFSGSIGFTGSLGLTGSQGIQGFTGSSGFTGSVGFTGSQGVIGFVGSQGVQGFTGSAGDPATVTIADDTTTNASRYITFVDTTSGNMTTAGVSSTKVFFNPFTGTLNATEFNSLSDALKKQNIKPIERPLSYVRAMNGVKFDWTDTGLPSYGVIAQELETIIPELVSSGESKSVNYNGLIAFLIESIKELEDRIRVLENNA